MFVIFLISCSIVLKIGLEYLSNKFQFLRDYYVQGRCKNSKENLFLVLSFMFVTKQLQKPDQFWLKVNFSKTLFVFQNTLIFNVLEKIK